MDRQLSVLERTSAWIEAGVPFVAALLLDARGSTPRKRGVRAAVHADGTIAGTIGGGLIEREAQRRAAAVCRSGKPQVFEVNLMGPSLEADDPICGGGVRVLLDPISTAHRAVYDAALTALKRRERGVLVTRIEHREELAVVTAWEAERGMSQDSDFPGSAALRRCLDTETAELVRDGEPAGRTECLLEPVIPDPRLLIVGGGHIGQALAAQASVLGFAVTVVDDRPEFTRPEIYPDGVEARCAEIADAVEEFSIAADTYVVIVTRGHRHDAEALAECIGSKAAYIGMVGSRRKVAVLREEFLRSGRASDEEIQRIFAPIGLAIGAVTVPEIATSIAAELVSVRRRGSSATRAGILRGELPS